MLVESSLCFIERSLSTFHYLSFLLGTQLLSHLAWYSLGIVSQASLRRKLVSLSTVNVNIVLSWNDEFIVLLV